MATDAYRCGLCGAVLATTDPVTLAIRTPMIGQDQPPGTGRRYLFHPWHYPTGDPDLILISWAVQLSEVIAEGSRPTSRDGMGSL